ncbi:MAG: calcium-binding EGF-like domain-containing protein [Kofleriaceae bacterium]
MGIRHLVVLRALACAVGVFLAACDGDIQVEGGLVPCVSDGDCPVGFACASDALCWRAEDAPGGLDECARGEDDCGTDAVCIDLPDGFRCECALGFTGDGHTCEACAACAPGTYVATACTMTVASECLPCARLCDLSGGAADDCLVRAGDPGRRRRWHLPAGLRDGGAGVQDAPR